MKVLVCGGRNFGESLQCEESAQERKYIYKILSGLNQQYSFTQLIHGGASGADTCAGHWAAAMKVNVHVFPADWNKYGKIAGVIRNREMLIHGNPSIVVAFPGGKGTRNMIDQARKAGVEVLEYKYPVKL